MTALKAVFILTEESICKLCGKSRKLTRHHILDMKSAIKLADAVSKNYSIINPHESIWSFMKEKAGCILICRKCHDIICDLYDDMNAGVLITTKPRTRHLRTWAILDQRNEKLKAGIPWQELDWKEKREIRVMEKIDRELARKGIVRGE